MDEAVAHVRALLQTDGSHHVVTLNATMLGQAARDGDFRRIVNGAALVTADGMGTLLVGRILGVRFPERVAGVDLTDRLCAMCAQGGFRVFLFGAAPGVAQAAAEGLRKRHPGLRVAGSRHGYVPAEDAPQVVAEIRSSASDLLLVALGSPKQEEWLARHLAASGARVGIGVGGSFDVYGGRVNLAPEWIRAIGLEWLYRILREPRRWRVVAGIPGVILLALKERLGRRWKRTKTG
jgi:N-acetylglucosaminyldiphosphoundecaprenol N-acetyl-beta-D-mannosaminyltransferase